MYLKNKFQIQPPGLSHVCPNQLVGHSDGGLSFVAMLTDPPQALAGDKTPTITGNSM